jgi:hypothetical protein
VLFAEEYNGKSVNQPQIRVRFYGNAAQTGLLAFIADPTLTPTVEKILPGIPFSKADGTPAFGRIQYNNSIRKSKIEIPHHYFNFGIRDLPAIGTLTNFQNWSDTGDTCSRNVQMSVPPKLEMSVSPIVLRAAGGDISGGAKRERCGASAS